MTRREHLQSLLTGVLAAILPIRRPSPLPEGSDLCSDPPELEAKLEAKLRELREENARLRTRLEWARTCLGLPKEKE